MTKQTWGFGEVCEHGQLGRVCEICERDELYEENKQLKNSLERENMRLVACSVVAVANTEDSAKRGRNVLPEYRSESLRCVAEAVDREMALRAENERLQKELAKYSELIYAVASKFPDETRHETALRYITQQEQGSDNAFEAALASKEEG